MVRRDSKGHLLKGEVLNPTGKGGFQTRPQDISRKWSKETAPGYLLQKYGRMTREELEEELKKPDLTTFQIVTLRYVLQAMKNEDPKLISEYFERMADRTGGKPTQSIDATVTNVEPPVINLTFEDTSDNS